MNKYIKLFWFFSLVGFLATILFVYSTLPLEVDVSLGSKLIPALLLSRNSFFYIMIAIVVLTNATLLTLAKVIGMINSGRIDETKKLLDNTSFKRNMINWLGSFSVILNLFYAMGGLFVGLHNDQDIVSSNNYSILAYISIILIIGWIFWLLFIILNSGRRTKAELN